MRSEFNSNSITQFQQSLYINEGGYYPSTSVTFLEYIYVDSIHSQEMNFSRICLSRPPLSLIHLNIYIFRDFRYMYVRITYETYVCKSMVLENECTK